MPTCERFVALSNVVDASMNLTLRGPDGAEHVIDINAVLREVIDAIRALERLIEQHNIPETSLGGLGKPTA